MYKSKFNQLYNQIITQMAKLTTNTNKKLLEYKKIETEYNNKLNEYNNLINKANQEGIKIVTAHPNLAKKVEKIKANPKNAFNAPYSLKLSNNQAEAFGWSLYRSYELSKVINRLKTKLDTLKMELGDLTEALATDITANLPEEFIKVLEELRQYIIHIYQNQKQAKVNKETIKAANPLKYEILQYIKNPEAYTRQHGDAASKNLECIIETTLNINELTDAELIPLFKQCKLQYIKKLYKQAQLKPSEIDYVNKSADDYINRLIHNATASLNAANNINPEAQGNNTFEQIKAQFLDKLSEYCTNIISAENVYLGQDGSINGIVNAENGRFYIRTIEAGGYNIQKLHFRVIVTPLNDKNYQKIKANGYF